MSKLSKLNFSKPLVVERIRVEKKSYPQVVEKIVNTTSTEFVEVVDNSCEYELYECRSEVEIWKLNYKLK